MKIYTEPLTLKSNFVYKSNFNANDSHRKKYNSYNVSFEGINFVRFAKNQRRLSSRDITNISYDISNLIGMNNEKIIPYLKGGNENRARFLSALAKKYNMENFYAKKGEKEDIQLLFDTYNSIAKPRSFHIAATRNISGNFEYLKNLLSLLKGKKSYEFSESFQRNMLPKSRYTNDFIIEMLKSPNREKYIKNPKKYRAYFELNKDNPNAVKELDELIAGKAYSQSVFETKLAVEQMYDYRVIKGSSSITKEFLERNYSASKRNFLEFFVGEYYPRRQFGLSVESEKNLMRMYVSANDKNVVIRTKVMDHFRYAEEDNPIGAEKEIFAMQKLFDLIDRSKHARKFVKKLVEHGEPRINSIEKLYELLEALTPEKANIFSENLFAILSKYTGKSYISELKANITDPFYETAEGLNRLKENIQWGYARPESVFSRIGKYIRNKFREIEYSIVKKTSSENSLNLRNTVTDVERPMTAAGILEYNLNRTVEDSPIKLVSALKQSPKSRKLQLISDVKELISKKLGAKTLEKQTDSYEKNATKMRLKLLPEIFDSISQTRKVDRLSGKLKPESSNKDAVVLYNLINGSNRKYIKYLLEKRNVDGSRMFEVKEIISMIQKANLNIEKMKSNNPNFKSKDAKLYFDHLYQSKIEQYGPVKRIKNKLAKNQ